MTLCEFCLQTQTWSSLHVSSALFSHRCVMWISLKYVLVVVRKHEDIYFMKFEVLMVVQGQIVAAGL